MFGEVKIPVDTFLELNSKAEKFDLIISKIFDKAELGCTSDTLAVYDQNDLMETLSSIENKKYKAKLDELKRRKEEKEC